MYHKWILNDATDTHGWVINIVPIDVESYLIVSSWFFHIVSMFVGDVYNVIRSLSVVKFFLLLSRTDYVRL